MNYEKLCATLHETVFRRYVRMPYGHLLDSADECGKAVIPTAEECKALLPSGLGWTTPIADCAMFGGLYTYALLKEYERQPTEALRGELIVLVDGLLLLVDVSRVDGFVARGVADDGVTHYPISSDDQVGPWILALWKALSSNAFDAVKKAAIEARLRRTLTGLIANDWSFCIETELQRSFYEGFLEGDWRNCARFLFAAAVARDMGLLSTEQFEAYANGLPEGYRHSRRVLLSCGFSQDMVRDPVLQQFWITICSHLSVCELVHLDPKGEEFYVQAIALNAVMAGHFLRAFEQYRPTDYPPYDHDWRKLLPHLNTYRTYEELLKEGQRANKLYKEVCPLRVHERKTLGQTLFSAWVAIESEDRAEATAALEALVACITRVDWNLVGQSYAFAAEAALLAYVSRWQS